MLKVQFQPRIHECILVCPMRHAAVIVDTNGGHQVVPLDDDVSKILYEIGTNLNIVL